MKRILIVGEKSYIAKSFEIFARNKYEIRIVSSRNQAWRDVDFKGYDSVLHCAGIAHVSRRAKMRSLYYNVNCDLAVDVAKKAKGENIRQFIFLSSILVYGNNRAAIDRNTIPFPDDFYGGSKLKAEEELQKIENNNFRLCVVRPPMVYGNNCKGNFKRLIKLSKMMPVFPDYPNRRSMIFIDNLCDFLCRLIDNDEQGIFLPQNDQYITTTELVCCISECYNKKIYKIKLLNPLISLLVKGIPLFEKLFGDLYYIPDEDNMNTVGFKESIKKSINGSML